MLSQMFYMGIVLECFEFASIYRIVKEALLLKFNFKSKEKVGKTLNFLEDSRAFEKIVEYVHTFWKIL